MKTNMKHCAEQTNIHPSIDATTYPQGRVFWAEKFNNESQKRCFDRWKNVSHTLSLSLEKVRKCHFISSHPIPA